MAARQGDGMDEKKTNPGQGLPKASSKRPLPRRRVRDASQKTWLVILILVLLMLITGLILQAVIEERDLAPSLVTKAMEDVVP